jgi:DNA-binding LacI/PurR family transcriptional regulator
MSKKRKRPTIIDVANHAGVSISTVSRVLNDSAPVEDDKVQAVRQAIEELNYQPKAAARILASQKTETIGLLLPLISGEYFAGVLRGVERGVIEGGFDLLIHSTFTDMRPKSPYRRVLGEHNTDGLIVFTDSLEESELVRLAEMQFPVVLLHRSSPDGFCIPSVTVENKNGAKQIVEHLIRVHNRYRIVYLRGPEEHEDSQWREIGYRQALDEAGIPFDPALVGTGNFNSHDAQDAIEAMLVDGVEFDAVFAGDDESASGVLRALRFAGLQVPDQVSVVGFDDSNLAQHVVPALTTMDAQVEQAGYTAAKQLIQLIKRGEAEQITLLPTQMVLRRSCGCAYEEVKS